MSSSRVDTDQLTKKMSRGVPDKRKAQCRLTPRDISLLTSLAENQFLTTSQIQAQYFPSIHRSRKRLNQLWWSGFVQRVKIPPGLELLSAEAVYSISRAGLRLLQAQGGHEFGCVTPKPSKRPGSLMFLSHTLLRNSFRIALENSVRVNDSVALHGWRHDASITRRVLVPDIKSQAMKSVPLRADACFCLKRNGQEIEFYLEVDNGTMPLTRLTQKLKAYQTWRQSQIRADKREITNIRILVLMFSKRRAQNLVDRLTNRHSDFAVDSTQLVAHAERQNLHRNPVLDDLKWSKPHLQNIRTVTLLQELQQI